MREDDFLSCMGAPSDEDAGARRNCELLQHGGHVEGFAFLEFRSIVFQTANDVNGFGPHPELAQSRAIVVVLATNTDE